MEPSELIAEFGRCVERHAATLLIGAGLSRDAGFPDWSGLLEPVRERLELDDAVDLTLLAQYYVNIHGEDALQDLCRGELVRIGEPAPRRTHELLAALPLPEIWTTNFDSLIERACGDGVRCLVSDDDFIDDTTASLKRIYKMHGCASTPAQPLVLARDQFVRYPDTHQRFWSLLQATFLTKSFLFLGFSFEDPNFEQIFRLVRRMRGRALRPHFALMRRPDQRTALFGHRLRDLQEVGIRVAVVDDHAAIEPLMRQLVVRCRPTRLFISGSPAGPKPEESGDTYPSIELDETLATFASLLGRSLAEHEISLSAAGKFGAQAGYEVLSHLQAQGDYEAERFTLLRRSKLEPLSEPSQRRGSIVFEGSTGGELRTVAFANVRAILAVGGGPGVSQEIALANEHGLGVIPVAKFGGASLDEWSRIDADFNSYRLGGLPVPRNLFLQLRDGADVECAHSAARLSAQALYLEGST